MANAEQVLVKIQEISRLYFDRYPLIHIDSLTGQLKVPQNELRPYLDELADRGLIKYHQSAQDLFMITEAGKKYLHGQDK